MRPAKNGTRNRPRARGAARRRARALDWAVESLESRILLTGLTPSQIRGAYGLNNVQFGASAGTGAGQTIAIIEAYDDPNIISDANVFSTNFGLQQFNVAGGPTLKVENQSGQAAPLPAGNTSFAGEESTDVEWAHAIAPMANIIVFEANSQNFGPDMFAAIDAARNTPGVSVVSISYSDGDTQAADSHFTTPAGHIGVTFVASSGDSGFYPGTDGTYPATSPNVVAVGGTVPTINPNNTLASETAWGDGSGGLPGSTGGVSSELQPTYQNAAATPFSTTQRTTPDVAWAADSNVEGLSIYNSYTDPSFPSVSEIGTSVAAPMWAGLIAVANQGRVINGLTTLDGPTQTLPLLYHLPAADFHDITTGNSGTPAVPGYDLVTGLGSPNAPGLMSDMSTARFYYVDKSGSNSGGLSWTTAFTSLQEVPAPPTNVIETVLVGKGTYTPVTNGDPRPSFVLHNNEAIYGGFAGTGMANPDASGAGFTTILSGANIGLGNNSYHVVVGSGTNSTAILDGVTISGGIADGSGDDDSPYGGGLYNVSGSPTIVNCLFNMDFAPGGSGGGMYNSNSSPTVIGCTFTGDVAPNGGGMANYNSSPSVTDCTFSSDTANAPAGGAGGGMYNLSSSPTINSCAFSSDNAEFGGGFFNQGYAFSNAISINGSIFTGNTAAEGGGAYIYEGAANLLNDQFDGNTATGVGLGSGGGGVAVVSYSPTLVGCVFSGNSATGANGGGGGMMTSFANPSVANCTFSANSATNGGAVANFYSAPSLTNCILWGDTATQAAGIFNYGGSNPAVTHSDVEGGFAGAGNLAVNPGFNRSANLSNANQPDYGDLSLEQQSPCVNGGTNSVANIVIPATDAAGQQRIVGGTIDMGAYETQWIYVDHAATGAGNGGSWANAYTTLSAAIAVQFTGELIDVSAGTYTPTDSADRTATFLIDTNVSVSGGYAGLGAPNPFAQDAIAHPTVLSGNINGNNTGDSFHVVTISDFHSVKATILLNELTISGGNADGTGTQTDLFGNPTSGEGGGLYVYNSSGQSVQNCTFTNNSAVDGGGMFSYSSLSFVSNCRFVANSATSGGGMYNEIGTNSPITDCAFVNNSATDGAAMTNHASSSPMLTNCTFSNNTAGDNGGGINNQKGSTPTITNCILWLDSAANSGNEIFDDANSHEFVTYTDVDQSGFSGSHNIDSLPDFIQPPSSGNPGNLGLTQFSPCINAGDYATIQTILQFPNQAPNTDLQGNGRIYNNSAVDMGAYEYQHAGQLGKLVVVRQPSQIMAQTMISPSILVYLEDSTGKIVTGGRPDVTISIASGPGGAVLSGTVTVMAAEGHAVFSDLSLNIAGNYVLQVTEGGLTGQLGAVTTDVTVFNPGATTGLTFGTQPSTVTTGQTMNPPVVVDESIGGVPDINDSSSVVTLKIGEISIASAPVMQGVATFPNLVFQNQGNFTLIASDGGDVIGTSNPFAVNPPAAVKQLVFGAAPSSIAAGSVISPAITVTQTQNGNLLSDNSYVTLFLVNGPANSNLNGPLTAQLVNGTATFAGLNVSQPGAYTIGAIDGNDSEGQLGFSAGNPVGTKLVFVKQPVAFALGPNVPVPTFEVAVEDANGNVITGDASLIHVALAIPSFGAYAGGTDEFAVNGTATFSNFFVGSAVPTTLIATDDYEPADEPAISNSFLVSPGPVTHFVLSGDLAGAGESTTVFAQGEGVVGNFTPAYTGQVTLTITNPEGVVVQILNSTAQAGVAVFSDIVLDQAGNYSLSASDPIANATGSGELSVWPANGTQLAFVQQPTLAAAGFPGVHPVVVEVLDQFGNVATADDSQVTISIATPLGSTAMLGGAVSVMAQSGLATFANLSIDALGSFTLGASDGDYAAAFSSSIEVVPRTTFYVDQNAAPNGDGKTWATAFQYLQTAMADTIPGDTIDVAQGDYSPGPDANDTFNLMSGVTIIGGFATGGASTPTPLVAPTYLDGDNTNYHVVTGDSADATAVLEDCSIINGNASNAVGGDSGYGGGFIADGGSPTLVGDTFQNNAAFGGGAAFVLGGSPAFLNDTFTQNTAGGNGGAMYVQDGNPAITNCLFTFNAANSGYGGAVYNLGSPTVMTNCTFTQNIATFSGGAVSAAGDGDGQPFPTMVNCIVWLDTTDYLEVNRYEIDNATVISSDVAGFSALAGAGSVIDGGGNIDADPMFVDPIDLTPSFQLAPNSPCVNVGNSNAPGLIGFTTDLAGSNRFVDTMVDMGAYEAQIVDVSWTGAGDGVHWSDPANWADDMMPTGNDSVTIPVIGGSVIVDIPNAAGNSLDSAAAIEVALDGLITITGVCTTSNVFTVDFGGTLQIGVDVATEARVGFIGNLVDNGSIILNPTNGIGSTATFAGSTSGDGTLTLTGTGLVVAQGSNETFTGPLTLEGGITLEVQGQLTLQGSNTIDDSGTLTIQTQCTSANPVVIGNITGAGSLTIGTPLITSYLRLADSTGISTLGRLVVNNGSTFDVGNNAVAINFGTPANDPVNAITMDLATADNNGQWNGVSTLSGAITSSEAQSNSGPAQAVGINDGNTDNGSAAPNQILFKDTIMGNANLDSLTNFADLVTVIQNFNKAGTDWAHGNFGYGASTNFGDLVAVIQNFNKMLPPAGSSSAGQPAITTQPLAQSAPVQAKKKPAPAVSSNNYQSERAPAPAPAQTGADGEILQSGQGSSSILAD